MKSNRNQNLFFKIVDQQIQSKLQGREEKEFKRVGLMHLKTAMETYIIKYKANLDGLFENKKILNDFVKAAQLGDRMSIQFLVYANAKSAKGNPIDCLRYLLLGVNTLQDSECGRLAAGLYHPNLHQDFNYDYTDRKLTLTNYYGLSPLCYFNFRIQPKCEVDRNMRVLSLLQTAAEHGCEKSSLEIGLHLLYTLRKQNDEFPNEDQQKSAFNYIKQAALQGSEKARVFLSILADSRNDKLKQTSIQVDSIINGNPNYTFEFIITEADRRYAAEKFEEIAKTISAKANKDCSDLYPHKSEFTINFTPPFSSIHR